MQRKLKVYDKYVVKRAMSFLHFIISFIFGFSANAVIGGQIISDIHWYRQTVGISISESRFCSGVYIGDGFVLTSAHCFFLKEGSSFELYPKEVKFFKVPNLVSQEILFTDQVCRVKNFLKHPRYKGASDLWGHDVALILVDSDSCDLSQASELQLKDHFSVDDDVISLGFGNQKMGNRFARAFPMRSLVHKADQITKSVGEGRFCYRVNDNGDSLYFGDSGGPAYQMSPTNQLELVGLFSSFFGPENSVMKTKKFIFLSD